MIRIAVFDVDNTLTESRSPLSAELSSAVSELSRSIAVAFISGGSFDDIDAQILSRLENPDWKNIFVLPTEGAELRVWEGGAWRTVYSYDMPEEMRARILEEISRASGIASDRLGAYIEDRGRAIAFHGLGTDAPIEAKYAWDPDGSRRGGLVSQLLSRLPGVFAAVAGSTTINFTRSGIDKSFGIRNLLAWTGALKSEAVFVGDSFGERGNDLPVKELGVRAIETSGPKETIEIVSRLLAEASEAREASRPKKVAYFCMEYALEEDLPMFAGGLGILAADIVRAGGRRRDLELSAIGLINRKGMKRPGEPASDADYALELANRGYHRIEGAQGSPLLVEVPVGTRVVKACVWTNDFGASSLYLLDTDVPENKPADRRITDYLYDTDFPTRIAQEMLIGIGGVKLLALLGIAPDIYHFNEGHTGFGALAVALERSVGDMSAGRSVSFEHKVRSVRGRVVATKHTILSGSGTYLARADFGRYLGRYVESLGHGADEAFNVGALDRDRDMFSSTKFLLAAAGRANGVSEAHVRAEKTRYPESSLIAITNGVDAFRWMSPEFRLRALAASPIALSGIAEAKRAERRALVELANRKAGSKLDPDICTVVWARRFVAYKRPRLLTGDRERLIALLASPSPIQVIFAGSAYLGDEEGRRAQRDIDAIASDPRALGRVSRLPEYSVSVATKLVRGADIWLNTPIPGYEACGTSGMKAGQNGSLVMSTIDGWVADVPELSAAGWLIGEDGVASKIYEALGLAAREFYSIGSAPGASETWLRRAAETVGIAVGRFDVQRMLAEYINTLYDKKR